MCTICIQMLYLETTFLTNNFLFIIDTIDREDLLGQVALCFSTKKFPLLQLYRSICLCVQLKCQKQDFYIQN